MSKKPGFAPLPLRALADARLSRLHLCALGIIAYRDRMSLVTGKGQGCWASSGNMAEAVGVNITNMSTAINQLAKWGYLQIEPLQTDKRKRTYRVIFEGGDDDHLPMGKEDCQCALPSGQTIEPNTADDHLPTHEQAGKIVCPSDLGEPQKSAKNGSQYISLSDERYSAEAGERDSAEAAHLAVRDVRSTDYEVGVWRYLAQISRGFETSPETLDTADVLLSLDHMMDDGALDEKAQGWARRLYQSISDYAYEREAIVEPPPAVAFAEYRECEACGEGFEVIGPQRGKPRRFCGEGCRKGAEIARSKARKREQQAQPAASHFAANP